jgi:hypothetical protein
MQVISILIRHTEHSLSLASPLVAVGFTDLGRSTDPLVVGVGEGGTLHGLAEGTNSHGLPSLDLDHLGVELFGGTSGAHVGGLVGVELQLLLEDSETLTVVTNGVVGEVERRCDLAVGIDQKGRLW